MAGTTLCVSCASLPLKDRASAVKVAQCPECKSACGVTSYGAAFRIQPGKSKWFLSATTIGALVVGVGLFVFVAVLIGIGMWSREQIAGTPQPRPETPPPNNEFARVPEVAVSARFDPKIQPHQAKQQLSSFIQEIRATNNGGKNKDAFVLANINRRPELRGLPFVMGDACRLDPNKAQSFQSSVSAVRDGMERDLHTPHEKEHVAFWNTYLAGTGNQGLDTEHGVAALAQILGPEKKSLRTDLVHRLGASNRAEATRVIARAAVFDLEGDVRMAAIKVLKEKKKQRDADVTEVLLHGLRYPMSVVAKHAAQAMIMLDRKDLLPQVADVLDEPSPGDPIEVTVNDQKVHAVREVVKINHHRNCLLCHPPSSQQAPESEVPGVMPIPGSPFPSSPKEAYGKAQSFGEPMVRADTTYLRQDFSMMWPVENAAPWPQMQRFDFLVRTRPVEGRELAALQAKMQARGADFQSENQKAAIRVLTELSGQQNVAANAAAWKRVVGGRADE